MEIHACYISKGNEMRHFLQSHMSRHTWMLVVLGPSGSPKHHKQAPIDAFPTFQDHLNAMCHMNTLHMDQRT